MYSYDTTAHIGKSCVDAFQGDILGAIGTCNADREVKTEGTACGN